MFIGSGAGNYEASCIIFVEAMIMQVIHNYMHYGALQIGMVASCLT